MSQMTVCEPAGAFACFTDAQSWQFVIDALVAFGTIAAVAVAVIESVRSARRARRADQRAAFAEAEARARAELEADRASSAADAQKLRIESDIAIREHWLKVAADYGDIVRQGALTAELAELRSKRQSGEPRLDPTPE